MSRINPFATFGAVVGTIALLGASVRAQEESTFALTPDQQAGLELRVCQLISQNQIPRSLVLKTAAGIAYKTGLSNDPPNQTNKWLAGFYEDARVQMAEIHALNAVLAAEQRGC